MLLKKVLDALSQQTIPAEDFEVVVIADGCSDNTSEMIDEFRNALNTTLIEQSSQGPSVARNNGASKASAELLIFLDDDVVPQPQFLEAHIESHCGSSHSIVIGYYPPLLENQSGYFRTELRDWWEIRFQKMRYPGHRYSYSDLLSGNFSILKKLFEAVGGFDVDFKVHEDFELGIRLLESGVDFLHSRQAVGYHHERSDFKRALQRKYEEGIADVQIGRLYPYLKTTLLINQLQKYSLLPSRFLKFLAIYWSALGDLMAGFLTNRMAFFERIRWHKIWLRLLYGLMGYWYWRGVSTELHGFSEVNKFLDDPLARREPELVVDLNLEEGIPKIEMLLDDYRPHEVRLYFNQVEISRIPYQPGSEPLRGAHLRPYLQHNLNIEMIKALAEDPSFPFPNVSAKLVAQCEEILKLKKKWA